MATSPMSKFRACDAVGLVVHYVQSPSPPSPSPIPPGCTYSPYEQVARSVAAEDPSTSSPACSPVAVVGVLCDRPAPRAYANGRFTWTVTAAAPSPAHHSSCRIEKPPTAKTPANGSTALAKEGALLPPALDRANRQTGPGAPAASKRLRTAAERPRAPRTHDELPEAKLGLPLWHRPLR
eukprot:GHVT01063506.1.p1 GENE.GHVT01063506.1~~GHVT01063506.1.p1  ORF type:complete len:180 (+),score=35.14 GHVT01063506.1:664-1203(+)